MTHIVDPSQLHLDSTICHLHSKKTLEVHNGGPFMEAVQIQLENAQPENGCAITKLYIDDIADP